jgi:hypothetical protein
MAAVYLVAFKQWGEQDLNRPSDAGDDKYHAIVIYTWILRKAVAHQQRAPNNDWAEKFDTLLEKRYPTTTDDQRAVAYTVALQWCGVQLPERPPGISDDDYNKLVITTWNTLGTQRNDAGRVDDVINTIEIVLSYDDRQKQQELLISYIKDPHINVFKRLYMHSFGRHFSVVEKLVHYYNRITRRQAHQQEHQNIFDCVVALVGRPDFTSNMKIFIDGSTQTVLNYVVGVMQSRIMPYCTGVGDRIYDSDVWKKYMIVVDRSVERAGTTINQRDRVGTPLTQAINNCSDYGSESWRDVTSTQMVEDMGELPLSNIATTHSHDLRCFSVVAALLNAKHIDVVGKETHNTPLYQACRPEFKWPIVVHLLDMLKGVPNDRLNDLIGEETVFQSAVQHSPGAVIALIKQPGLMPNKREDDRPTALDLFTSYGKEIGKEMVEAALTFVGAVGASELTDANKNLTVGEYTTTPFEWPAQT